MAHLALYRSWRPKTFNEVVGQDYIVTALRMAVVNEEIAHALLFTGTRGTGKTSLAKIYARAINCLNPQEGNPCNACDVCTSALDGSLMDIMEIDAASNNSVDNIRSITDEVHFTPSLARYKVYIIDEVHMLSTSAFNALLKTLEEPPAHAVFILATTDPQRIPATILSRCQRFDLKRIGDRHMMERLAQIAEAEKITIDNEALLTIAHLADGALRDAISLLDQTNAATTGDITRKDILDLVGMVDDNFMGQIIAALIRGDAGALLNYIHEMVLEGEDIYRFCMDLTQYYRNILVTQTTRRPQDILRVPRQTLAGLKQLANAYSQKKVVEIIQFLAITARDLKQAPNPRISLEVALIQLLNLSRISDEALNTAPEAADQGESEKKTELTNEAVGSDVRDPDMAAPPSASPSLPDPEDLSPDSAVESEPKPQEDSAVSPPPDAGGSHGGGESDLPMENPVESTIDESRDHESPDDDESGLESEDDGANGDSAATEEGPHVPEPVPADMPSLPEFLQTLGQTLITRFSNAEAAIVMRSGKASWEGRNLRLDFAPEQDKLYNVLMKPELRRTVNQALQSLEPELAPELVLHLNEEGERLPDGTVDQTPEWFKKIRQAAEELGIPLEIRD